MTPAVTLDRDVLQRLLDSLGDPAALRRFLVRYLDLLGPRVARLQQALASRDVAAWDDAALSLRSASAMAGATALAEAASAIRGEAPCDPMDPFWASDRRRDAVLDEVVATARNTAELVAEYLDTLPPEK